MLADPVATKRARDKRWRENNGPKIAAAQKKWRDENPDKVAAGSLKSSLARYGIDAATLAEMKSAQNGQCALCDRPKSKLVIDHDHKSGSTRALLCQSCNVALGLFQDDPRLLAKAARYVAHFGAA